jgi:hypothetical protein
MLTVTPKAREVIWEYLLGKNSAVRVARFQSGG